MSDLLQIAKQVFPYLTDEQLITARSIGELVPLNEGEIFIKEGERSKKVGLVVHGIMRNYILNDNGEQVTVVFATEMQTITTHATILLNRPASETCEAVEPTMLFVFDYGDFNKLKDTDPVFSRVHAQVLELMLIAPHASITAITPPQPIERYQRLLDKHGYLIERAPLKYLASYLGITPVSLSRIRKRLSKGTN